MAKNLVVKTKYIGEEGTIVESFCILKRKLYKKIAAEIEAFFDEQSSDAVLSFDVVDGYGDTIDNVELDGATIFGDDSIEVISVSKITAEEMIEVFGHEYGQLSLLEIWAAIRDVAEDDQSDEGGDE